jgi:choline dehydrogenase-like flavoprotein
VQAEASDKVTIFLHANVTEVLLTPDGSRVEAVLVRNFRGDRFRFEADEVVLSAGTIETSRLLLQSRSIQPAGVGNTYGRVGVGFHDHVTLPLGDLRGETRSRMLQWFGPFLVNGTTHTAKLEADNATRSREHLLAVMAYLTLVEPERSGAGVVRDLLRAMQRGNHGAALRRALPQLPNVAIGMVRMAWAMKVRKRRDVSADAVITLRIDSEQFLSHSRITLCAEQRDALDQPKAVVDWSISDEEILGLLRFAVLLQDRLAAAGLQQVDWKPEIVEALRILRRDAEVPPNLLDRVRAGASDTFHPMGGTVMGTDPVTSVVDTKLRVHGVPNLSIASASVYPAGGSSNPTFTLMALTLQLADRLCAGHLAGAQA